MDRLDRKDFRFIGLCLATIVAGAAITIPLFHRAFPEASIEFRVNRNQARSLAEQFLASRGRKISGHRFAGRFGIDEEPKVYLERELGLEQAGRFYGREAKVWRWEMRWFRSGVKEEERVEITPLGDLAAFESVLREDAAGPSPREAEARTISQKFLTGRGLAHLLPIEAAPIVRPHRTDWRFVGEKIGLRLKDATVRYETTVSGGVVTAFREFVHVPEAWERDYRTLRSKNETANVVGNFALILTFLAMLVVLLTKIVRHDVPWGLVGAFGATAFVLYLLSSLNGLPLTLYNYDTASPFATYVTSQLVGGLLLAIGAGAGIALIVAGSEPIYRERFPGHLSLRGVLSSRGIRSKRFFRGVLLGYALTAFFFAYQVVFYIVASHLGAWSPADVKYDDILSTAFPWATVLLIGFLPAVIEEGTSRVFSISFLGKLGAGRWLAVVLPAFIWGFNHAAYPNQPFYIRGVEVGLAGCVMGLIFLRFGVLPLLVWHFTVDALYTALILLRSGNTYYVVSGALASLILLIPLAVSAANYLRRGGFEPEAGLTNADEGFVPAPAQEPVSAEAVPPVRSLSRAALLAGAIVAILLAGAFLIPSKLSQPLVEDAVGRRRAEEIAREFLKANAVQLESFRSVSYAGSGFADDGQVRAIKPDETGRLPGYADADAVYVVLQGGVSAFERVARGELPIAFWVVRFFRPLQKEEWKVLVGSRRGRVIGFLNPIEEKAAAASSLSEDRARARALSAAAALGYPAAGYKPIEVGTQDRPARRDTTVVLESSPKGIGDAHPRLTSVFHGNRLAAFYPSLRVPEEFRREYRRQSPLDPIFIAVKVIAIGSFLGIGIVLFIRLVRGGGFQWRRLWPSLAIVAAFAALHLANGMSTLLRAYQTEFPLSLFVGSALTLSVLMWLVIPGVAAIGFVLFSGARPGWRRALRTQGTIADAAVRGLVAAAGFVGLDRLAAVVSERVPQLFDARPALPPPLERVVPAISVFWTAAVFTFLIATAAAVVAIAARDPVFARPWAQGLIFIGLILALAPASARSPAEWFGAFGPSFLKTAWLAFCAFALLRNHAAAWVFFGALASGLPAAAKLLAQPAPADRMAGAMSVVLLLFAAVALVAGGRRERPVVEPASTALDG